jgi:CheY-like chemotaxis protein
MKKGKILVIDDDPNFRLLMKKILQADGHTVVEASDIQSAISLGKSEGIDLAFLDINLQNENGREFLLKRAQDSILQSFAVIMCSQDSKGEIDLPPKKRTLL